AGRSGRCRSPSRCENLRLRRGVGQGHRQQRSPEHLQITLVIRVRRRTGTIGAPRCRASPSPRTPASRILTARQRVARRQRSWRPIRRSAGGRGLPRPAPFATHGPVLRDLRELASYGSLLRELVARDLKVRYKRSVLGVLWTMLNPLFLMLILAFVFSHA